MLSPYRLFARVPNYVRAFGVVNGLRLCVQVERPRAARAGRVRRFNVGWTRGPIWLRDTISDHAIFWQCIVAQHYELDRFPHTQRLRETYGRLVERGKRPLIIDGGGNIGLSAIWFALKFPQARILVIEPDQGNFDILGKNVAAYTDCVQAIRGGVWPRAEKLQIQNPSSGAAAYRVRSVEQDSRDGIRGYTVGDLLELADSNEALIVKLDIEGSQKFLFQENTEWVGRCHLIILELDDWLYPWEGTSQSFFKCISEYPFEYLISGEHVFCFRNFNL